MMIEVDLSEWEQHCCGAGCSAEHRLLTYRVRPEVADDAVLPGYVGDGQDAWLGQD